jgi:gas vesicle protein
MKRSSTGAVVGAFLGGAILGGVIALLFAPKSGAETRSAIKDFALDEIDMLRERGEAAREYVEDEIDRYKQKARRATSELTEMVEDVKECVRAEKEKLGHR